MCSNGMQSEFHTHQQDRVTENAPRNTLSPLKGLALAHGAFQYTSTLLARVMIGHTICTAFRQVMAMKALYEKLAHDVQVA